MVNNKIFGLIGFAARARKIAFGADSVESEILKKKVKVVIMAEDASQRTKDKFNKICNENNIPIIEIGKIEELSKAIGKSNKAIIGVEEKNLSIEIQKIYNGGEGIG